MLQFVLAAYFVNLAASNRTESNQFVFIEHPIQRYIYIYGWSFVIAGLNYKTALLMSLIAHLILSKKLSLSLKKSI